MLSHLNVILYMLLIFVNVGNLLCVCWEKDFRSYNFELFDLIGSSDCLTV
jgi:hypothetical protein